MSKLKAKKKNHLNWVIKITVLSFIISFIFSFTSEVLISKIGFFIGLVVLIFFVTLGVIFDMVGIAITASSEKVFYSMASKKVHGARLAIRLKKNAPKVSSFCNDVIGDICGIMSGSAGVTMVLSIAKMTDKNLWLTLLVTSLIAAVTIGGKALGKTYALKCTVVETKPITCTHCGAPVELRFGSGKCEYCGTFYTTNFEVIES